jgi:hypothetical protein
MIIDMDGCRALEEKRARLGLVECVNHELLQPYPVLHEKLGLFEPYIPNYIKVFFDPECVLKMHCTFCIAIGTEFHPDQSQATEMG